MCPDTTCTLRTLWITGMIWRGLPLVLFSCSLSLCFLNIAVYTVHSKAQSHPSKTNQRSQCVSGKFWNCIPRIFLWAVTGGMTLFLAECVEHQSPSSVVAFSQIILWALEKLSRFSLTYAKPRIDFFCFCDSVRTDCLYVYTAVRSGVNTGAIYITTFDG